MPVPAYLDAHKIAELVALEGRAKVSYPYDSVAYPRIERIEKDALPPSAPWAPTAYGTADEEYAGCILTAQSLLSQDDQYARVYRVWETLPGPVLTGSRFDAEGGLIVETRQAVLHDPANNIASASGATTIRYDARGDSSYVDLKITTITALDGVVRSYPTRVNLGEHIPRVLAGLAITYNVTKGEGDDTGLGSGGSVSGTSYSGTNSSSARASSSLTVIPEVYAPMRDDLDLLAVPAMVKQVYLSGAVSEAAIRTKLAAVYEVAVTGSLSPNAVGTLLGNSSDVGGVIWFATADTSTYQLKYGNGEWRLGTPAGLLAGNYWKQTAAATAWLGTYTAHGTNTGTATVSAGRTVNAWPSWGVQEVQLKKAGKQVSVSSNASASESVGLNPDGGSHSTSINAGFSVSTGGNSGRETIPPTLHGAIIIANPSYTESVNATAAAPLSAAAPFTCSGVDSGVSPSHAQTVVAYVRQGALGGTIPATVPPDVFVTGLYLHPNFQTSAADAINTKVLGTIIDFVQFARAITSVEYSDPAPHYHIPAGAIQPNQPIHLGGAPASYSITPALSGLALDIATGIISGTPSTTSPNTITHTVTATNAFGPVTCTVVITTTNP